MYKKRIFKACEVRKSGAYEKYVSVPSKAVTWSTSPEIQSKVGTAKAMVRYYALAVPQLLVQWLLNQGLYSLLGITESQAGLRTLIHILVMCVLFIISFTIQQRWVFAPEKSK